MLKKIIIAVVVVFITWSVLDFVIHGILLHDAYMKTADLWRSMEEMKMELMYVVGFIAATCFVFIYALFINPKSLLTGLKYGVIFGIGAGTSMGYGSYCVMPIPYYLALVWFLGMLVETIVGGLLVGAIVKDK